MKQYFYSACMLLAAIFYINTANAQPYTITNHNHTDSCTGGITFWLTTQNATGLTFETYYGDGTSHTDNVYSGNGFSSHPYSTPGTYTFKHILYYNGTAVDSVQSTIVVNICSFARISVYYDANNNCQKDVSEQYVYTSAMFEIDSAGVKIDTVQMTFANIKLTTGKTYTFRILTPPLGTVATCPANGAITATLTPGNTVTDVLFGVQSGSASQYDLAVHYVTGHYRPVNLSYLYVPMTNNSFLAQNAVTTVTFDSKYNYFSASPTPSSVSGNVVTWNISNLSAISVNQVGCIILTPATTINIGDVICTQATIMPNTNDAVPVNNSIQSCDSVVSSWDPNSKEVSPAGLITPGTKLTYTIHFENTGNDTAFNIHVLDTLSEYLEPKTFQLVSSSHRIIPSILTAPNGRRIINFDLPDIRLADSSHPEANKGTIIYSVNTRTKLIAGTQITNRAGIYFDVNPVVMTNEVVNWTPVGIQEVPRTGGFAAYPNPVSYELTITTDNKLYQTARLMNNVGQVVREQSLDENEKKMNVESLPAGIYFLNLRGTGGTATEKIEKM